MQGKLYSGSSSMYEDEAKILFDYFSNAADKIIHDEDAAAANIEQANTRFSDCKKLRSKHIKIDILLVFILFAALGALVYMRQDIRILGGLGAVIFAFFIFAMLRNVQDQKKIAKAGADISVREQELADVRRTYRVDKLGVAYVPVAKKVPFGNQNITVDLSGAVPDENFELVTMNNPNKFETDVDSFKDKLMSIPLVEGSAKVSSIDTADYSVSMQQVPMYDYLSSLNSDIDDIKNDLADVKSTSVALPVISPESEGMSFLKECGTSSPEGYPVVDVFQSSELDPKLDVLFDIYSQRQKNANTGNEEALESLISFIGLITQTVTGIKMNCCTAILDYNDGIFANVLKSPYRNYSTKLEAELIEEIKGMNFNFSDMFESYRPFKFKESSIMKFDLYSNSWIDETGGRTSMPFGLHQIYEEIFMPIISNLMEENRVERRKIYDKIQEQKMNYLNKWHTETQDFYGRNRDAADALKSNIIEAMATYNSSYATWKSIKDTIEKMDEQQSLLGGKVEQAEGVKASMVVSAEQVNENFKKLETEFDEYMDRLQDDIDDKADSFGKVTFFEAYLYASEAQKAILAGSNLSKFDNRQLKVAKINPYLAEYGQLPPQPDVEQDVYSLLGLDLTKEAKDIIEQLGQYGAVSFDDQDESAGEDAENGSVGNAGPEECLQEDGLDYGMDSATENDEDQAETMRRSSAGSSVDDASDKSGQDAEPEENGDGDHIREE